MAHQGIEDWLAAHDLTRFGVRFRKQFISSTEHFAHLRETDLAKLIPPLGPRRKAGYLIDTFLGRDERSADCLAGYWCSKEMARFQEDEPIMAASEAKAMVDVGDGRQVQAGWALTEHEKDPYASAVPAAPTEQPARPRAERPQRPAEGSGILIKLKGLPFRCKYDEIRAFFRWEQLETVYKSVYIEVGADGRKTGVGYARLATEADVQKALDKLNGQPFSESNDRTIRLFRATEEELEESKANAPQFSPGDQHPISRNCKARQEARRAGDFDKADQIRDQLAAAGVQLQDDLFTWTRGDEKGAWGPETQAGEVEIPGAPEAPPQPQGEQAAAATADGW